MSESLTWSVTLLSALHKYGVRHAVISPGSRSTPLTLAAAIHLGIQKKVVLDERSAGFIALGIGKATGTPAVLISTSGTAVANYYPAVVEAKESGVPLIVLSADRPPNLRNLGSSQTVDQLKIFGSQTVFFHEAGEPRNSEPDLKRIAYAARQAVEFSTNLGGAAHINLPFRKPLEPDADFLNREEKRLSEEITGQENRPSVNVNEITLHKDITELISSSKRPLLIAGAANPSQSLSRQVKEIAGHLKAPLLGEPGSQADVFENSVSGFDLFLRNPEVRNELEPDLILRFGDQPYSTTLLRAFENWIDVPVIHITARHVTQDHEMNVAHKIFCRKTDSVNLENIHSSTPDTWLRNWKNRENEVVQKQVTQLDSVKELTDGHVISHFSKQVSNGWNVMLSNSLPARDMLTFGKPLKNQFVNRGAAGIDGIMSTALGIHWSSDKPTLCFVGDLAFLHDSNALYSMQHVKSRPFVVVVINNQGGNIFRMLPIYRDQGKTAPQEIYQTYFETPQKTDIRFLAKASGIHYQKAGSLADLRATDLNDLPGAAIIECATDPEISMKLRIELLTS